MKASPLDEDSLDGVKAAPGYHIDGNYEGSQDLKTHDKKTAVITSILG